jgi:hypothetical protein
MAFQIVAQGYLNVSSILHGGKETWWLSDNSTLEFSEVRKKGDGHYVFKFKRKTGGLSVYVTGSGVSPGPGNLHNDASPVVRDISDTSFEVEVIVYDGSTVTGYSNKNASFWFLVVQGIDSGLSTAVKIGNEP